MVATVFEPHQWGLYLLALALSVLTYGLIGMIVGPVFGRVAGAYMAFLIPFLDLGIGQSPMLQGEPAAWAHYLPGTAARGFCSTEPRPPASTRRARR